MRVVQRPPRAASIDVDCSRTGRRSDSGNDALRDALERRQQEIALRVQSGLRERSDATVDAAAARRIGVSDGQMPRSSQIPGSQPDYTLHGAVMGYGKPRGQGQSSAPLPGRQLQADPSVVVFLDVDGVLHSLYGNEFFTENCMRAFDQIVLSSNATVILSSTWRLKPNAMTSVHAVLKKRGLMGIADRTPDLSSRKIGDVAREEEILHWLRLHPEVQHWIAIDDMDLAAADSPHRAVMRDHFVKTDSSVGLQRHVHVAKALQLLNNDRGDVDRIIFGGAAHHSRRSVSMGAVYRKRVP
eukprot:gnl/TRDRNA2_/TRDRNA2_192818_c0_seq1.p1 gnl/TRDRNA2_/TRDRNA2_192818_c0~~gnl/TRDRNA2_/TRDRNA2_192818_c0_seq1.p1  ORF type:complete len:299 (-),score=39.36 gnl/TRDRNA2_/TRDRNA2_192818_c0_seq1:74-970(-)